MNAEGFEAPGNDIAPAELPLALQAAVITPPVVLSPGIEGYDFIICLELTAYQKPQGS